MSVRRKIVSCVVTLLIAAVCIAPTAAASQDRLNEEDFRYACISQYNIAFWPQPFGNNAYSWKCTSFFGQKKDIDVNRYCRDVYGTSAGLRNPSDLYGWYCK